MTFGDLQKGDKIQVEYNLFLSAHEKYEEKVKDISFNISGLYHQVITLENGIQFECDPNENHKVVEIDGPYEEYTFTL